MGERTGVLNSSHSGTGLMSKGAGLARTQAPKPCYTEKTTQHCTQHTYQSLNKGFQYFSFILGPFGVPESHVLW